MSSQSFRKKTRVVFKNMDLKSIQSEDDMFRPHTSKHLNNPTYCKVCNGGRTFDIQTQIIEPLIGHHVKYFPPVIAFVHFSCHEKIHDVDNPLSEYIQYEKEDSKKYYNLKNEFETNKSKLNNSIQKSVKKITWSVCN